MLTQARMRSGRGLLCGRRALWGDDDVGTRYGARDGVTHAIDAVQHRRERQGFIKRQRQLDMDPGARAPRADAVQIVVVIEMQHQAAQDLDLQGFLQRGVQQIADRRGAEDAAQPQCYRRR